MLVKPAYINFLFFIPFVFSFSYEKPVSQKLWQQRCVRNALVLNDCNWCRCSENFRYTCEAKVCGNIDMFGHFNDAIQDINVGMEGHGVWRSTPSACEPGVHYNRGNLLCVCTEDGSWPHPVCRDTFRTLHPVEVIQNFKLSEYQKCTPTLLYLADCNVCLCPSNGRINPSLCTQKKCTHNSLLSTRSEDEKAEEVYAECGMHQKYKVGCKSCICLRNNRLVCDNCTRQSECAGRLPGENFIVDCNTCNCDAKGTMYCTVNRCLNSREEIEILKNTRSKPEIEEKPYEGLNCLPGTGYLDVCNTCFCYMRTKYYRGKKWACTLKKCSPSHKPRKCDSRDIYTIFRGCAMCYCGTFSGRIREICETDPRCLPIEPSFPTRQRENSLQECIPNQVYTNGC